MAFTEREFFIDNKLRLAITNCCNLSCFYCHNEGQPHGAPPALLPLEYVESMVRFLKKNNIYIESINITGGEPILHPDLLAIAGECAKVTDKVRLNTNATLLAREMVDRLIARGVTSFKIGVDSLFAKQTKPNIHTVPSNIEKTIELIKYASSKFDESEYANTKQGVVLNTVVTQHNYCHVDDMVGFAAEAGIGRMKVLRLNDLDSREMNDSDADPAFKTDQPASWYYYGFCKKYLDMATRYDLHVHRGRLDVFVPDGRGGEFEIRFCDDVCESGACALMFTEIDAGGNIMACPRHHLTAPVDFGAPFGKVSEAVRGAAEAMCDSRTKKSLYLDNFRDMGGIPLGGRRMTAKGAGGRRMTAKGAVARRMTAEGAVARSANPVVFGAEKARLLREQGYTTVIDVRRPEEALKKPSRYWESGAFEYFNLPLTPTRYDIRHESFGHGRHVFEKMIEHRENVAVLVRAVANANGGVIIHCAGGKHRTGTVAALLLSAVGMEDPGIIADYSVSFQELDRISADSQQVAAASHDIASMLGCVREIYGSTEGFLTAGIGLAPEDMAKLRQKLVRAL